MEKKFEITLKNIKFYSSLSQETNCFQCDILVNGVKSFYAENDGRGGCTTISNFAKNKFSYAEIDNYFRLLPIIKVEEFDFEYQQSFESKVDDLFQNWLNEKQRKKLEKKVNNLMKNNIVCQDKDDSNLKCYFWKDRYKKNVPIETLLSIPKFEKMIMDKIDSLKNEGLNILNTNIPKMVGLNIKL